jgi:hypothetical protein
MSYVNVGKLDDEYLISSCPYRASLMTKRHNNVARIIVQAIEANNRRHLIKSETGQYIHCNQELRLPDMFNSPKRKPDICYYIKVKKVSTIELNLNIVEVTILLNDAIINSDKFDKNSDPSYMHVHFDSKDVQINALAEARNTKIDKYDPIVNEAENLAEIRINYKALNANMDCKFIVISNLDIIPKEIENDMCSLIDSDKKERLRYGRT